MGALLPAARTCANGWHNTLFMKLSFDSLPPGVMAMAGATLTSGGLLVSARATRAGLGSTAPARTCRLASTAATGRMAAALAASATAALGGLA